jgi:hypothetical protein
LGESELRMLDAYREACLNLKEYRKEIELYPDSIGEMDIMVPVESTKYIRVVR